MQSEEVGGYHRGHGSVAIYFRGGLMPGWDLLDDEPDQSGLAQEVPKAFSAWDSLHDEQPQGEYSETNHPARAWRPIDNEPEHPARALPPPELAASQLEDGEVLWARVDGQSVTLGSGQPLNLSAGIPDGMSGWRRVRITHAASLRAEVLAFQMERPAVAVADEPSALFPPEPARIIPARPSGFPVGQGGDLAAAFHARVGEAVQRLRAEMSQQIEIASQAASRSEGLRREAERMRDKAGRERALSMAAAVVGWICVLILVVVLFL